MEIKKLTITNFRGFKRTEVNLLPGLNVVAGLNGAGKSTILDASRLLLSRALHVITKCRADVVRSTSTDVSFGMVAADISGSFVVRTELYNCFAHLGKEDYTDNKSDKVREQTYETSEQFDFTERGPTWRTETMQPFALFFSPLRSVFEYGVRKKEAVTGSGAIYNDALENRPLKLTQVADWWLSQEAISIEQPLSRSRVDALRAALSEFIPEFTSVTPLSGRDKTNYLGRSTLQIVKKENPHIVLDASQLSDGERSMLALVLDTARRLSLAYSSLENPIRDGEAIILIDEIELHLHPKWQREVTHRLEKTFPKCQFIITTHSPQVLGEVEPQRILLLEDWKVYNPNQSLGMDSDWILCNMMGASDRNAEVDKQLKDIGEQIKRSPDEALRQITILEEARGPFPELQMLRTKAEIMLRMQR